jgi:hypothetical protein
MLSKKEDRDMSDIRYSKSGMGKTNVNKKYCWEQLPFGEYTIDKPTIICLSGNHCTEWRKARKFCSLVEDLIGVKRQHPREHFDATYDDIDILGFYYGEESKGERGYFSKEEVDTVVNDMFLPLCLNDDNTPKATEEAMKNMSMINFFTFCQGSIEVSAMMNDLKTKLLAAGFQLDAVHKIMNQIGHVSYAPISIVDMIPTVKFKSAKDDNFKTLGKDFKKAYGYELNGIEVKHNFPCFRMNKTCKYSFAETLDVYSSELLNNSLRENNYEHAVNILKRDDKWQLKEYYEMGMAKVAPNADAMSQMMAYALARMMACSINTAYTGQLVEKPRLNELATELESVKSAFDKDDLAMY